VRFDAERDLGILLATGKLPLRAKHPRIHAVGGAFSYSISADPLGSFSFFDGLVARVEAAYFFNKKFSNPAPAIAAPLLPPIPFAGEVIEDDELSLGVVLEKTHKFHPDWLATTLVFEWWHRTAADLNEKHQSLEGDNSWDWFLFSVTQRFLRNEISVTLNTFYDTGGGWFLQPAVTWKPTSRYQVDVFYNWFSGGERDVYGALKPNREMVFRLSMFF
jgi:hypothetical protein